MEWSPHGTRVEEIELEAIYKKGRRSVDDFVEQTALANPHAALTYVAPKDEPRVFTRVTEELPKETKEIKPHPHGVELGCSCACSRRRRRAPCVPRSCRTSPACPRVWRTRSTRWRA